MQPRKLRSNRSTGLTCFIAMLLCTAGCQPDSLSEVSRFASGRLKSEVSIKRKGPGPPIRDGWYRSWHENGRLHEEGLYVAGKTHGVWSIWDEEGRKRGQQRYHAGKRHGTWYAWHANGRLAHQRRYNHGRNHGQWREWDDKGNIVNETFHSEGAL